MKKILLLLAFTTTFSHTALAQEEESSEEDGISVETTTSSSPRKSISHWGVSLSTLQWNETLRVQDGVTNSKHAANYNALTVTALREITYKHWGWSFGAFIGSGRANGGAEGSAYLADKVAFTTYGIAPRAFYRLSGRVNAGLSGMMFYKNIDWPENTGTQQIDAGRKLFAMGLLDLNVRLFQRWDFYSGLGPLTEGATLWKIGVNYRF